MTLRNVGILPQHYMTSQPEDLDMNLRRLEYLISRITIGIHKKCYQNFSRKIGNVRDHSENLDVQWKTVL